MKLKTKALPPASIEFELEGSKEEITKWLNKTLDFVRVTCSDYPEDKFSLKLNLKELGPIQVIKPSCSSKQTEASK
jgi:hypothetical protein